MELTTEGAMKNEIFENGPITSKMLVFADLAKEYTSGVYHFDLGAVGELTNQLVGSHAVLLTGWGEDTAGVKHWIVKNSWGADWGEDGYFKIRMGDCYLA